MLVRTRTLASSSWQTVLSCCCPGVRSAAKGLPRPSQTRCSFVEKPPRERPKASHPLFRPGRGSGGPDVRGVGKPGAEIHQPLRVQPDLEPLQDAVEGAIVGPRAVPVVRALPGAVTLRKVSPRGTAAQDPQDCVEHLPRVAPLAAGGFRGREKIADELPLPIVEFVSFYHESSVAVELFFVVLRQSLVAASSPSCPPSPRSLQTSRPPPAGRRPPPRSCACPWVPRPGTPPGACPSSGSGPPRCYPPQPAPRSPR